MRGSERGDSARTDIVLFAACTAVAILALALPRPWSLRLAGTIRKSVLRPIVALQDRAAQDRAARFDLTAIRRDRDLLAIRVQQHAATDRENANLRALLGVRARMIQAVVPATVLHQPTITDSHMLLLDVGTLNGVANFNPVVSAYGLLGAVINAGPHSSSAMTWAHPDFAVSAVTEDGKVMGFVRPAPLAGGNGTVLELHGVAIRDTIKPGTIVLTAGAGGTYPHGIPIGRVTSGRRDENGYDAVYRIMPFANPGDASDVIVLISPHDSIYLPKPAPAPPPPAATAHDSAAVHAAAPPPPGPPHQ
ncbi:MAG TPA: rod shape-determining protein MreC [Gemmatimonadales bacterium]|jgi:rod shape-determining protein MreC